METSKQDAQQWLGTVLDGRYTIKRFIGEGGMGFVFRGSRHTLDKDVAIKILRPGIVQDKEATHRFLREARAASNIGHPNIINVFDFGTLPDGSMYCVMEYLDGQSLMHVLEQGALSLQRTCHIGIQIARALDKVHEYGVIHRDLKPDNVFLVDCNGDPDFVKLIDFGIAKVLEANTKLTQTGRLFGTPQYMSPEQACGSPVDHRVDIYALGIVLYEMLTGKIPFEGGNFMDILYKQMHVDVPAMGTRVPGIECPPELEAIVMRCLQKQPSDRYLSMKTVADELERYVKRDTVSGTTAPPPSASRSRRTSIFRLFIVCVSLIVLAVALHLTKRQPTAPIISMSSAAVASTIPAPIKSAPDIVVAPEPETSTPIVPKPLPTVSRTSSPPTIWPVPKPRPSKGEIIDPWADRPIQK